MHKTTILLSMMLILQSLSAAAVAEEVEAHTASASPAFAHSAHQNSDATSSLEPARRVPWQNQQSAVPFSDQVTPTSSRRNELAPWLVNGLSFMVGTPSKESQIPAAGNAAASFASQPSEMPGVLYSSETKTAPLPSIITGIVYTIPGVRASTGYKVVLPGTPLSAPVASDGTFTLYQVPPWRKCDLRVVPVTDPDGLANSPRSFPVCFAVGDAVTVYDIVLYDPGSISGTITGLSQEQLAQCAVTVDNGQGSLVAAKPDCNGAFLLQGVAPGQRDAKLQVSTGVSLPAISRRRRLLIRSGEVVLGVNFGPLSVVRPVDVGPGIEPPPPQFPLLPVRGGALLRRQP